jgi:hypothetical protein
MFQLFHLVLVRCSRCCCPRALTHGHARAARTHPMLPITVIRANSNSRACTQRAVNVQIAKHSLVKSACTHAERQSRPAPNGRRTKSPCTSRLGPPWWSIQLGSTRYVRCAPTLSLSHVAGQPHTHSLLCRRSRNTCGLRSSNRRKVRSMRACAAATARADPAAAGAGREASWAGAASQQV